MGWPSGADLLRRSEAPSLSRRNDRSGRSRTIRSGKPLRWGIVDLFRRLDAPSPSRRNERWRNVPDVREVSPPTSRSSEVGRAGPGFFEVRCPGRVSVGQARTSTFANQLALLAFGQGAWHRAADRCWCSSGRRNTNEPLGSMNPGRLSRVDRASLRSAEPLRLGHPESLAGWNGTGIAAVGCSCGSRGRAR